MTREKLYGCVLVCLGLGVVFGASPGSVFSVNVLDSDRAAQILEIRNVTVSGDEVAGEVVNGSDMVLRDIELQIRYIWRWQNEFKPQDDRWGRTVIHTIDKELLPGQSTRFSYKPSPPVESGAGGYFDPSVSVAGFEQVVQ